MTLFFLTAAGYPLAVSSAPSGDTTAQALTAAEEKFPYVIPVEGRLSREGFLPGDGLTIAVVRGDRPTIEPGGTYLVEGTYVLGSSPRATLALSLTTSVNGGRSTWSERQRIQIEPGTGPFALVATMHAPGEFHVSFYLPDSSGKRSHAQGGIYFRNR